MKYILLLLANFLTISAVAQKKIVEKDESIRLYAKVYNHYNSKSDIKLKGIEIKQSLLSYFTNTLKKSYAENLYADTLLKKDEWSFLKNKRSFLEKQSLRSIRRKDIKKYISNKTLKANYLEWYFFVSPIVFSENKKRAFVTVQPSTKTSTLGVEIFFFEQKKDCWHLVKHESLFLS